MSYLESRAQHHASLMEAEYLRRRPANASTLEDLALIYAISGQWLRSYRPTWRERIARWLHL